MSDTTTHAVRIQVKAAYIPNRSLPSEHKYFFAYRIRISNLSDQPVQLLNRHWVITDGTGDVQEVRGAGVIGEQPQLAPQETFEYTSFCPLSTPVGSMRGSYDMLDHHGEHFDATIGAFTLAVPHALN